MREGIVTDIPKASMVLSVWENDIKNLEDKKMLYMLSQYKVNNHSDYCDSAIRQYCHF